MRIVLLTRNEIGGVLTYVVNFSQYLKNNNVDHLVILSEETTKFFHSVVLDTNLTRVKYSKFSTLKSKFAYLKRFILSTDILIVNDTTEMEFINYYQLKNKSIFILHGDLNHYQGYLEKYHNAFDDVFCVSKYLKDKYREKYPHHSLSIAHPMVEDFYSKKKITCSSPIKIVSIGRFEFLKGADTINNTINYLNKYNLKFSWTLFIPPSKNDEELLNKIPSNVIVKQGYNNFQVLDEVEQMDVLFFPSRSEGFSMSVIECLKRGIIVIARDIPMGIPEVLENNINGMVCKSEKEFQLAMRKIIAGPEDIVVMKKNALRLANDLFSYDKECKILFDLISSTRVKTNKRYVNVGFSDPKLPEFLIRIFRFIKYDLFYPSWN